METVENFNTGFNLKTFLTENKLTNLTRKEPDASYDITEPTEDDLDEAKAYTNADYLNLYHDGIDYSVKHGGYIASDSSNEEAKTLADALNALYSESGEEGIDDFLNGKLDIEYYFNLLDESKEEKPSAGLTKKEKSAAVKKAKAGKDIGEKGKSFEKVAQAAGGGEKGQKIAAAAMWKNIKR